VTDIPAKLVKQLRDETGAGMMAAKQALVETGGDLEAAKKLLREKGLAAAMKRGGRRTSEGEVLVTIAGNVGAIVAVGCETEPVSKNEEFLRFAEKVLETVEGGGAPESLDQERIDLVAKIGENVDIVGATRMTPDDGQMLAEYVHPPANKVGVLVKVRGSDPVTARQLAMHISWSAPRYVSREQVPDSAVAEERSILEKQQDVASKPEHVRGKIVEGRLDKWYADSVLVDQQWIHETSKTVAQALKESGLEVVDFVRYALAE
jgi:elongation factor Ts